MNYEMPAVPALSLGIIDVRDVAAAHIIAMRNPKTDGERILLTTVPALYFKEMGEILHKEFSKQGMRSYFDLRKKLYNIGIIYLLRLY